MAGLRKLIVSFKSTRELNEDEIDMDKDVDDIKTEFGFSDNGMYLNILKKETKRMFRFGGHHAIQDTC